MLDILGVFCLCLFGSRVAIPYGQATQTWPALCSGRAEQARPGQVGACGQGPGHL